MLLLAVTCAILYQNALQVVNSDKVLSHTRQTLTEIASTLSAVENAEAQQRNLLITGDSKYLAGFDAARVETSRRIQQLKALIADNPLQQQRVATLSGDVTARIQMLSDTISLYQNQGYEAARRRIQSGIGSQQMDAIRQLVSEMEDTENSFLEQRTQQQENEIWSTVLTFFALSVLVFVLLILAYRLIKRDITGRRHSEQALRQQKEELAALHETTLGLINHLDPTNLLETTLSRAATLLSTEHGFIFVVDPGGDALTLQVGIGLLATSLGHRVAKGVGFGGRILATNKSLVVEDYSAWSEKLPGFDQVHAIVGIPLFAGGGMVGVLGLAFSDKKRRITQDEITLMERFGRLASLALDNARLYAMVRRELAVRKRSEEALHEIAARDDLTGLYNRRGFDRLLSKSFVADQEDAPPLSLILFDIDHFKSVNDSYGHQVGDMALKWIGAQLQASMRSTDFAARYGGEEFAVILPNTESKQAARIGDRFRRAITKRPFVAIKRNGLPVEISIAISLGVSGLPGSARSCDELVRQADYALYRAKQLGRNRTILFGALPQATSTLIGRHSGPLP